MHYGVYVTELRRVGAIGSTGCFREAHQDGATVEKQASSFDLGLVLRLLRRLTCVREG